jgi:hypothetical protein
MRLKNLSNKLKNTKIKIKRSERELKLRMLLKAIVLALNTLLMMKNSRTKFLKVKKIPLKLKLNKLKDG